MSIKASFSPPILIAAGDNLNNPIAVSRDAAENILVNGGAVSVEGGQPRVANTSVIETFGEASSDKIVLDETNGVLPSAFLFGGAGNDVLTGGSIWICSSAKAATTR